MKKSISTLLIILLCSFSKLYTQVVSTLLDSSTERITDALILDEHGNLYGSDYNGDKVYKLSPDGELSVVAEGLGSPNGLAFDSNGNLFICDNTDNRIYTLDSEGNFIDTVFISSPSGIIKALDSDTMIFTQYTGHTLNKLSPDGDIIQTHSGGVLNGPVGLAYDGEGRLYVGNFNNREIYEVLDQDLEYVATVPGPSGGNLGFIAYGAEMLWGTSFQGDEIYQIEPNYIDSVILYSGSTPGSMDGPIEEATFNNPNGIITNLAGDSIYISQYPGGEIRLIGPEALGGIEYSSAKSRIYPNPSQETIQVTSDRPFDRIELFDLLGNSLVNMSWPAKTDQRILEIGDLKTGIYLLRLLDGASIVGVQRLAKE